MNGEIQFRLVFPLPRILKNKQYIDIGLFNETGQEYFFRKPNILRLIQADIDRESVYIQVHFHHWFYRLSNQ